MRHTLESDKLLASFNSRNLPLILQPHEVLTKKARINYLVLCQTDTAVNARLKIGMTMLAETALKLRRQPEADFHGYLSSQLYVTVGKLRVFREDSLCLLEKSLHSALRYKLSFTSIPGKLRHTG